MAVGAIAIPAGAVAAPAGDLIVTGSVTKATASYETASGHIDRSSLSSVKKVDAAYVELLWAKPDLRDEAVESKAGPKVGDRTPLLIIGAANADAEGRYSISGKPTPDMVKAAAENDGWLNFLMATSTGADYVLEGVSRHWDGSKWTSHGDERPGMSPGDLHRTVFATDIKTGKRHYGTNPELLDKPRNAAAVTPASISGCDYLFRSYESKYTAVMEFHNSKDSDSKWEYGGTADSDIDVGVKYDGANWTIGGTSHVGNSSGSAVGQNISSFFGKYVSTLFRYKHVTLIHKSTAWCSYNGDDAVLPDRWDGNGIQYPWDVSQYDCYDYPQLNYRFRYEIGQFFRKWEARAAKIGIAVSFGPLNLGSTSGYSSRVDMQWTAVRNWIFICGSNDSPSRAKIVYTY